MLFQIIQSYDDTELFFWISLKKETEANNKKFFITGYLSLQFQFMPIKYGSMEKSLGGF